MDKVEQDDEQDDLWGIGNPRRVFDWLREHLEGEPTKDWEVPIKLNTYSLVN